MVAFSSSLSIEYVCKVIELLISLTDLLRTCCWFSFYFCISKISHDLEPSCRAMSSALLIQVSTNYRHQLAQALELWMPIPTWQQSQLLSLLLVMVMVIIIIIMWMIWLMESRQYGMKYCVNSIMVGVWWWWWWWWWWW